MTGQQMQERPTYCPAADAVAALIDTLRLCRCALGPMTYGIEVSEPGGGENIVKPGGTPRMEFRL